MWAEELKNGKYRFAERYTDPLTGKQKKISVVLEKNTAKTRKEAFDILQLKIDKALTGDKNSKLTLKQLVELYRIEQKQTVKASTYQRNYFACKTLLSILGEDILVDKLNAGYIRQKFLTTGKEMSTLNEHLTRLKALLRWGYRSDLIHDISYLDKLERFKDIPHRQKIQDKFLEASELKTLLDYMNHERWKDLTEFLALSGLRFGEAAALLVSDVDLKNRIIHITKNYDTVNDVVTTPKTSCSIRDIYIQDELLVVCKRIENNALVDSMISSTRHLTPFISNENGQRVNFYTYNKYLRENSLSALGRGITPHTLRHTHASLLMEQGIDIETISRRLGHENSKITREIYLHVTDKLKEKENEQLREIHLLN